MKLSRGTEAVGGEGQRPCVLNMTSPTLESKLGGVSAATDKRVQVAKGEIYIN